MTDEIALFIDFENIRYSLINVQRREPDPQELIGVARRFGTVMVARAYADWARQPEFFKGSLTAAMIDRVDCPAKVRERFHQNAQGAPYYPQADVYERGAHEESRPEGEECAEVDDATEAASDAAQRDAARDATGDVDVVSGIVAAANGGEGALFDDPDSDERQPGPEHGVGYGGGYYQTPPQAQVVTQSTVDLNMLMDIIETVFDRPSINTFVLMSGDRDFTRICARLKLRLNKRVIIVGVPGTVSRDLISAAEQFVSLGSSNSFQPAGVSPRGVGQPSAAFPPAAGPVEPDEPGFIQFLDYIDRHWSWRTVSGVANFIGDPFNPKNRFRGRLTRDSARELLKACIDDGILLVAADPLGGEDLRLNREHPVVGVGLSDATPR